MNKTALSLALLLACGSALATGNHGQPPASNQTAGTTNNGGDGGSGVGVGVGIAAAAAFAAGGNGGVGGSGGQGGAGGLGGSGFGGTGGTANASGNGSGNQTQIAVGGSVYEAASAPAYAPAGSAPRTSCRLFVGLGGTSTGGSLSGGIPVGNDQTCLSGAQFEFMDRINALAPKTFESADYLRAACKVEGMGETDGCKRFSEGQRVLAVFDNRSSN